MAIILNSLLTSILTGLGIMGQPVNVTVVVWAGKVPGKLTQVALDRLPEQVRDALAYALETVVLPSDLRVDFYLNLIDPKVHGAFYSNYPVIENRRIVGKSRRAFIYMGRRAMTPERTAFVTAHELGHAEHYALGLADGADYNDREGYADMVAHQVGQACGFTVPSSRRWEHNWAIPGLRD